MKNYIFFQNSREAIEKFRGEILISRNYQSDPEMDFYVGDLIEVKDLSEAVGEIVSRESDFTVFGKEYLIYALQNSNIKEIFKKHIFRPEYISNFEDLMNFSGRKIAQRDSPRLFNVFQDSSNIADISVHLGIDIDDLHPPELREYDVAFRKLNHVFHSVFSDQFENPLENFRARHLSSDTNKVVYVYMFKMNYSLTFSPALYIQDLTDGKGVMLNNSRETVKILFPNLKNTVFNYHDKNFLELWKKLLEKVKQKVYKLPKQISEFRPLLKKEKIPHNIIPIGGLWDDIRQVR